MDPDDDTADPSPRDIIRHIIGTLPHADELGLELMTAAHGAATVRLPYQERLVGNPETGILHGGAVTTLIDTVCGMAAVTAPETMRQMATLDLRIDYLRPAAPPHDLYASAEVYKSTRTVVFVRATAYQDDPADPVASATGTFVFTNTPPSGPPPAGGTAR